MAFTPCASLKFEILEQAVIENLKAVVEVYRGRDRLHQIQVDELAQEERARHYQKNDTVSQSHKPAPFEKSRANVAWVTVTFLPWFCVEVQRLHFSFN